MERRTLGIVGLPELAVVLRDAGVDVVEGEERGGARIAAPISDQLHRGRRFPVLLAATSTRGLLPWAERIAALTDLWVVRHRPEDTFDLPAANGWLVLPVTVDDLLATVGVDRTGLDDVLDHELVVGGAVVAPGGRAVVDAESTPPEVVVDEPGAVTGGSDEPDGPDRSDDGDRPDDHAAGGSDAPEEPGEVSDDGSVAGEAAGDDGDEDGMASSTCAHCGEPIYGVANRHLWWHLRTRAAACASGGTVATPAFGPAPPAGLDDEATATGDPSATAGWRRDGAVVFCAGAKGGVGKTTLALALAAAASERGLDVVLVDANRGQGDVAHYLRLSGAALGSVHDAAVTGRAATAVVAPEELATVRQQWLDPITFSVVLAPSHDGQADPGLATARVYDDVVRHAASRADLVVVDTQILERVDVSGLVARVAVPLLEESAWLLLATDMSSASIVNTRERLEALLRTGATADRVLVVPNRVEPEDADDVARLDEVFVGLGEVAGAVPTASAIAAAMNAGNAPVDADHLRPVVDDVLLRVTGNDAFAPPPRKRGRLRAWMSRRRNRSG